MRRARAACSLLSTRRWARGRADDEAWRDDDVGHPLVRPTFEQRRDHRDRGVGERLRLLAHRGEVDRAEARDRAVVVADDGDVLGDPQPRSQQPSRRPIATRSLKATTAVGRPPAAARAAAAPLPPVGLGRRHRAGRPLRRRSRAAPSPRGSPRGAPGRCCRGGRRRTRCARAPTTRGGRPPPRAPSSAASTPVTPAVPARPTATVGQWSPGRSGRRRSSAGRAAPWPRTGSRAASRRPGARRCGPWWC